MKKEGNLEEFQSELTGLINTYNLDGELNTPDFILSEYLVYCIINYAKIKMSSEEWSERK